MSDTLTFTLPDYLGVILVLAAVIFAAQKFSAAIRRRRIIDRLVTLEDAWASTSRAHELVHTTGTRLRLQASWGGTVNWDLSRAWPSRGAAFTTSGASAEDTASFSAHLEKVIAAKMAAAARPAPLAVAR